MSFQNVSKKNTFKNSSSFTIIWALVAPLNKIVMLSQYLTLLSKQHARLLFIFPHKIEKCKTKNKHFDYWELTKWLRPHSTQVDISTTPLPPPPIQQSGDDSQPAKSQVADQVSASETLQDEDESSGAFNPLPNNILSSVFLILSVILALNYSIWVMKFTLHKFLYIIIIMCRLNQF